LNLSSEVLDATSENFSTSSATMFLPTTAKGTASRTIPFIFQTAACPGVIRRRVSFDRSRYFRIFENTKKSIPSIAASFPLISPALDASSGV